jgi:hypothetical protein
MSSDPSLLRPEDCALLLVDLQAGLAFGVGSEDRQVLLNNAVALVRTAQVTTAFLGGSARHGARTSKLASCTVVVPEGW